MRILKGNHKSKRRRYTFPLPLVISSDSDILITDGKVTLTHKGNIVIYSADTLSVQFEPQERREETQEIPKTLVLERFMASSLPEGYMPLTSSEAKTASHGKSKSTYEYYKRERDMSYIVLIRRNGTSRSMNLGSLFDPESIMSIALDVFSREKPFYRRDLKPEWMPKGLKQGQIIKACLDILAFEKFLLKTEVLIGKKRKTDRYHRTEKRLP